MADNFYGDNIPLDFCSEDNIPDPLDYNFCSEDNIPDPLDYNFCSEDNIPDPLDYLEPSDLFYTDENSSDNEDISEILTFLDELLWTINCANCLISLKHLPGQN